MTSDRPTSTTADDSRRVFVARACQLAAGLTLGTAVQGCGGGGGGSPTSPSPTTGASALPTATATVATGQATLTVDGASPLATVGSMALVRASGGDLLVARTGQDSFSVLTATCTHEACQINGAVSGSFACPCHGSRFSSSGAVLNGPATRALRQFPSQFSGGVLTVTL